MSDQLVCGVHAVTALLNNNNRKTRAIYINEERQDERIEALIALAKNKAVSVERLSFKKMHQRFAEFTHQGVVAEASVLPQYSERDLPMLLENCKEAPFILILDSITDPHNLGACLRSADASGVDFIIIPKDKSAMLTPVVNKVACGAAETVPLVRVTNLVRAMEVIKEKGVWIYGAAGEAIHPIYSLDLTAAIAVVLGAEGDGLRRLTREHCDGLFSLPMRGSVESLNVSVATGITNYEVVRQRYYQK